MFFFIFLEKNTLDIDVSIRYGLYEYEMKLKLRSSRAESNWPLWATVGQNSSSVQMASAYHVGAAVLVHVARSGQLDSALDE